MAKKPGKWVWLKAKYPKLSEDPEYDEVLRAATEEHQGKAIEDLAVRVNELEDQKAALARDVSEIDVELQSLEWLILKRLDDSSIDSIRVGGYNFKSYVVPGPKVVDPALFRQWVDEKSPEILSVNHQTLRGIVSRCLEEERDLPPGIGVEPHETLSRKK